MMFALCPVEALASKAAPTRLELCNIQSHAAKPFDASWRDVELLLRNGDEKAPLLQGVRHGHADTAGQMVVATASELKALGLAAGRLSAPHFHWTDGGERFYCQGYVRAGQTIVTVSSLRFDHEKASSQEFAQVRARRLCGHTGHKCQFPGGPRTSVEQAHEDGSARRIGDQESGASDIR